jgi:hypothetical protein
VVSTARDSAKDVKRVPCEVYSRIVGYLRPVQDWNEGKQQEFAERKAYQVPGSLAQDRVQGSSTEGD